VRFGYSGAAGEDMNFVRFSFFARELLGGEFLSSSSPSFLPSFPPTLSSTVVLWLWGERVDEAYGISRSLYNKLRRSRHNITIRDYGTRIIMSRTQS